MRDISQHASYQPVWEFPTSMRVINQYAIYWNNKNIYISELQFI
jgi:hypothetical protein